QRGTAHHGLNTHIPYLVEAWAEPAATRTTLLVCVNRTPVTAEVKAYQEKRDIYMFGCGITQAIAVAPKDRHFAITLNVITPYMPITSDGKAPNLEIFLDAIQRAASSAVRKAHRPTAGSRISQKDIVLDNLEAAIDVVSGDRRFRFNERQVLYVIRKVVHDEIGETLTTQNFTLQQDRLHRERGFSRHFRKRPGRVVRARSRSSTSGWSRGRRSRWGWRSRKSSAARNAGRSPTTCSNATISLPTANPGRIGSRRKKIRNRLHKVKAPATQSEAEKPNLPATLSEATGSGYEVKPLSISRVGPR